MITIGIDTGGTFTDFVYMEDGTLKTLKISSTPDDPSIAVLNGINSILSNQKQDCQLIHGSTVATNTLLTRTGAKIALITTKGFEDILLIGRQNRNELFNIHYKRNRSLVENNLCIGIKQRHLFSGEEALPLDQKEVLDLIAFFKEQKIEAISICYLFSYINPEHELQTALLLKELNIPISSSCEILPEYREYERISTTTVNAYVAPKMSRYIENINHRFKGKLNIMQSNGGMISATQAKKHPVQTILSGPAGGVLGALLLSKMAGYSNIITFDMGGTSTDASLCKGEVTYTKESMVADCPISVPVIDIHTVGTGGGSIANVDEGGALKVGPMSAGADPGPICYGKGEQLTVSDAHLFLGRLDPEHFLGGKMKIYKNRIDPYMKTLATQLGLSPNRSAEGIISVANIGMARAIRMISLARGHDPREFTLVSFGGAGGLHACELASMLSIPRILIPNHPGLLASFGMLLSNIVKDFSLSVLLVDPSTSDIKSLLSPLKEKAYQVLSQEGISSEDLILNSFLDIRYKGQSFEITIPFTQDYITVFHHTHQQLYGHSHPEHALQIVNIRIQAVGITDKPELKKNKKVGKDASKAYIGKSKIIYNEDYLEIALYNRDKLKPGNKILGPAIIYEYSSTLLIPPDFSGEVDEYNNILLYKH